MTSAELWHRSRAGARAGRGFRFQDAAGTAIAIDAWVNPQSPGFRLVPEGFDDFSIHVDGGILHLQIKSRRAGSGPYTRADLRSLVADVLADHMRRRDTDAFGPSTLVIELPADGVSIADVGGEPSPAEVGELVREVAESRELSESDIEEIARLVDVRLLRDPWSTAVGLVVSHAGLPDAAAELVVAAVQDAVGKASDDNFSRTPDRPAVVSVADVQQMHDAVVETIDIGQLGRAVELGILRGVDWNRTADERDLFRAASGTASAAFASQLIPRPHLADVVIEGLRRNAITAIAGPSGSGKSGLALLSAFDLRHQVRWQELLELNPMDLDNDAATLAIGRVRALRPTANSPVGVLIDNAGRHEPQMLEKLLRTLLRESHVQVLVTVREEDRFPVPTLATIAAVRPGLDDEFAEALWARARDHGLAVDEGWREAAERGRGLLLEFLSVLIDGDRLEAVVGGQVKERERDPSRRDELRILKLVASANQYGVSLTGSSVAAALGIDAVEFQTACRRLADEHLIVGEGGQLAALHELRSGAIARAANSLDQLDLLRQAASVVEPSQFGRFLRRSFADFECDAELLKSGVERATSERDLPLLSEAMGAFRLSALGRRAREWHELLAQAGVADGNLGIALGLAKIETTDEFLAMLKPEVADGVRLLRESSLEPDISTGFQILAAKPFREWIAESAAASGIGEEPLRDLIASLRGDGSPEFGVDVETAIVNSLPEASVDGAVLFLESLRVYDPELAIRVVESVGIDQQLKKLKDATPWLLDVSYDADTAVVTADWLFFDEDTQKDPHGEVVEVCRRALALLPSAARTDVRAVTLSGRTAMIGQDAPLADKRIAREKMPVKVEVAENRAAARALEGHAISARSFTAALELEATAARAVRNVLPAIARAALLNRRLDRAALGQVQLAQDGVDAILRRPFTQDSDLALANDDDLPSDSDLYVALDSMMSRIAGQLAAADLRERKPGLAAFGLATVIERLGKVQASGEFEYLASPPDLRDLQEQFRALQILAQAVASAGTPIVGSMRAAANHSEPEALLTRTAAVAGSHAASVAQAEERRMERSLMDLGVSAEVRSRADGRSYAWPSVEFLVIVDGTTALTSLESIANVVRESDGQHRTIWITFTHDGLCLAPLTFQVISQGLLPLGGRARPDLDVTWAPTPISDVWLGFVRAVRGCSAVIRVAATRETDHLLEPEAAEIAASLDVMDTAVARIQGLSEEHPDCEYLVAIKGLMEGLTELVEIDRRKVVDAHALGRRFTAELDCPLVLDPSADQLQDPADTATVIANLHVPIAIVEDDFENADLRIEAMR